MSKLDELIQELCPNGVEYKLIKNLAEVGTGSSNGNESQEDGEYPFFIRSQTVKRKNEWEYEEEAIIIPGEGGIGEIYHYVNGRYALHQRVYRIHFTDKSVDVKFAYHYFQANFKGFIVRKAVSATVMSIRKPMIEDFPIPVPPLEVQREIVRILDNFTALTAELTAELTARKQQYEYYRDKLLTFDTQPGGVSDVVWLPLSEIFTMRNGYTPSKANKNFWENGTIPWFRMEDIRENGRILSDSIQHITPSAVKGKLFPANSIIMATTATIGEHALIIADSLANQQFTFFSKCKSLMYELDMKYAFYYFFKIDEWCKQNTNVSSFSSVDMSKLKQYKFPIPPIEKQREIVSILDRFDALCNDLAVGLPAEIEARKKQYEFYRDRLLSFKDNGGRTEE